MDYRIDINDSDYPDPYDEEPKRKFHYRPVPNYLREYIKRREDEINTFKKRKKVLS